MLGEGLAAIAAMLSVPEKDLPEQGAFDPGGDLGSAGVLELELLPLRPQEIDLFRPWRVEGDLSRRVLVDDSGLSVGAPADHFPLIGDLEDLCPRAAEAET
jgi:hypothetical protein